MATALVTGANRGIGFEVARQLVARDWDVLVAARDRESGPRAASTLGPRARFVELDVADPASVAALAAVLEDTELAALVNNAGASFDGFDAGVVDRTLNVNFRGPVRVTEALLPRLAPDASIVMVSSGMGELARFSPELARRFLEPKLNREALDRLLAEFRSRVVAGGLGGFPRSAYGVSKAALNAYTRILARELRAGRRVNAVCPGWVRTRMGGQGAARSVEQGAKGIVWAATLQAGAANGGFFRDGQAIDW
jgi:NAD(P)-dependent dehydrogenase (short-subunit alcohol dehydrogenase family)